jgi:hypothetical protein
MEKRIRERLDEIKRRRSGKAAAPDIFSPPKTESGA